METASLIMLAALAGMFLALVLSLGLRSSGPDQHAPGPGRRRRPAPAQRSRRPTPARRSTGRRKSSSATVPASKLSKRERQAMLAGIRNTAERDPRRMGLLARDWLLDENRRHA